MNFYTQSKAAWLNCAQKISQGVKNTNFGVVTGKKFFCTDEIKDLIADVNYIRRKNSLEAFLWKD